MGIMYFDAQPIPEVEAFVREHYKGGTVIDYGCGCGRYAHLFPDDMYLGVDGYRDNIDACRKRYPNKKFLYADLDMEKVPSYVKAFDYLFSSVVLDQIENLPMGWAKTYILIENKKYAEIYKPIINEPLDGSEETRMMVAKEDL